MKITITEIEANAEELKASNTLADSLTNMLRRVFWNTGTYNSGSYSDEPDDGDEE